MSRPDPPARTTARRGRGLPLAGAGAVGRVAAALAVVGMLKLVIVMLVVAVVSRTLIEVFALLDTLVLIPLASWAALGPPRPTDARGCLRRAAATSAGLVAGLGIVNVALYRPVFARSEDAIGLAVRLVFDALPAALLGGLALTIVKLLVVTGLAFAVLRLSMPRAGRAAARPRPAPTQPARRPGRPPAAPTGRGP